MIDLGTLIPRAVFRLNDNTLLNQIVHYEDLYMDRFYLESLASLLSIVQHDIHNNHNIPLFTDKQINELYISLGNQND